MDKEFLKLYNDELQYIRELSGEFARAYPRIAGRLALDSEGKDICPDPFVERLLEGFAFLTARVQRKYSAEFPRFTQGLLETVYPHYLCPLPSMAVVQFNPVAEEGGLAEGYTIPRETPLRGHLGRGERTPCEYRTAHPIKLFPFRIAEAQYYTRDLGVLNLPGSVRAKAAMRIRLEVTADVKLEDILCDDLEIFIRGSEELPVRIYEQIFAQNDGLIIRPPDNHRERGLVLPTEAVERCGFSDGEALLPPSPRGFEGYRLLSELFAFPQRFLFFRLKGLREALQRFDGKSLDLIIPLKAQERLLENQIDEDTFELFCTPAINLFPKRVDRVQLTERFSEYHIVADKTRSFDFEIFSIDEVEGLGTKADEVQVFQPFYLARDFDGDGGAYYTTQRTPRVLTAKEKKFGKKSSYTGTELYMSLVDVRAAPFDPDLKQLAIKAHCTNRHLPLTMAINTGRTDFSIELGGPIDSVRCVAGPTAPKPSFAEGETAWRIISHLSLNYFSITDSNDGEGATGLRELLKLYGRVEDLEVKKQIEGVVSVQSSPIVRRVASPGPIAFARGLEITIEFDEDAFEGSGIFVLGAVLEQFFAKYVSLNSFTETVIKSRQRGEVMRWPTRVGKRMMV